MLNRFELCLMRESISGWGIPLVHKYLPLANKRISQQSPAMLGMRSTTHYAVV